MVNAQTSLNEKYSDKPQVKEICLNYLNFDQPSEQSMEELNSSRNNFDKLQEDLASVSQLVIDGYPNLNKIHGENIPNLTKLTITNCPQLGIININSLKNLQQLILNNLPRLSYLNCFENNLTEFLDLSNFANLETVSCSDNQIDQIKLPQGGRLRSLNLRHNHFDQDLTFLSGVDSLEELFLEGNFFCDSLKFLEVMSKLEILNINDTDIDSGLEYLPESVEDFRCSDTPLINAYFLEPYKNNNGTYNLKKWRADNQFLIAKAQLLADKEQQIARLEAEILTKQEELEASLSNQEQLKQEKSSWKKN